MIDPLSQNNVKIISASDGWFLLSIISVPWGGRCVCVWVGGWVWMDGGGREGAFSQPPLPPFLEAEYCK